MPKIMYIIKYPCGLEMEYFFKGIFVSGEIKETPPICPLHGVECKSK